jgi:hypothetical protein
MVSSVMLCRVAFIRTDVSEQLLRVFQLLVTANFVPSSLILSTLIMDEIRSFETSLVSRATRRHIPEDGILHSHRREGLTSYRVENNPANKSRVCDQVHI